MKEQAFEWKLTPTERRIAEVAFASAPRVTAAASASARSRAGARWAVCKVLEVRGVAGAYMPCTDDECAAMLAELRSEPEGADLERRAISAEARLRAVCKQLEANGCDCGCDHAYEEHDDDCERCLACRINEAVQS